MNKKILYLTSILLLFSLIISDTASAQRRKRRKVAKTLTIYDIDSLVNSVPLQRRMFHEKIDKAQRMADASDGRVDGMIYYAEDTISTSLLTESILKDVNHFQIMI